MNATKKYLFLLTTFVFVLLASGCLHYTMKESSIGKEIKTIRIGFIDNKARYVNPQVSPQLTEKLKQKIIGQTRLRQTNSDDAHYDISGYVSDYSVTTTGIANQNASQNRLNVTFHLIFKNTLDSKKDFESDVTSNYDFSAQLTLPQAEAQLGDEIVKNVTDAIFNKIFSNW